MTAKNIDSKTDIQPIYDFRVLEIISNWETMGLVVTDVLGIFAMIFMDGCFAMYYLIHLKRSSSKFNKLLQRFTFVSLTLNVQEKDTNQVGKTRLKFLIVMVILM